MFADALTVADAPSSNVPLPVTVPPPLGKGVATNPQVRMKFAATVRAALIVTVHAPVPVQSPPQLPKR